MKNKITVLFDNMDYMNSTIDKYLKEIRKIVPSYERAQRGRGQSNLLSKLSYKDQKNLLFLENKIKLERNRIAAKKNRQKRKSALEKIMEENENLKLSVESLIQENSFLKDQIKNLNKPKIKFGPMKKLKDKQKKESKEEENSKLQWDENLNFLDVELEEPIIFNF